MLFFTDLWPFGISAFAVPWLASGGLTFTVFHTRHTALKLSESHTFEWWLYKKDNRWKFNEFGLAEELGIQFIVKPADFGLIRLSTGLQMEVPFTNQKINYGWYIRLAPFGFRK